jgi:hypothetical protein
VQMTRDQIVRVVPVRHLLVPTTWSVPVCRIVCGASMPVGACIGICRADADGLVFIGVHHTSPF